MNINLVKQLRSATSASIADCQKALTEANGDLNKAKEILRKKGIESAEKKADRIAGEGLVESYVHGNGKVGSIIVLSCETDFVARTAEFKSLAHEIAMQVAAMSPKNVEELLKQDYIRDGSKTIENLIKETIAKLGENIVLKSFTRAEV